MTTIDPLAKAPVKLSFSVGKGRKCFELTPKEKDELGMKPDDWAWRFLRLNNVYRQAYADARASQTALTDSTITGGPKPPGYVVPSPRVTFNVAECRQRFGLSTWLDPEELVLPSLKDGESWFAPLMSVVSETRFSALKSTIFGYEVLHKHLEVGSAKNNPTFKEIAREPFKKGDPWMDGNVWFAIDCSIPPDGQLASIDFIAMKYASEMRKWKLTKTAYYQEDPVIRSLEIDPYFSGTILRTPFSSTEAALDSTAPWRMMKFGLVGPRIKDLETCRNSLTKVHEELVKSGIAAPPFRKKFKTELDPTNEITGGDGNALKAYVLIAECHFAGLSKSQDIIDLFASLGAGSQTLSHPNSGQKYDWLAEKDERAILFDRYAKAAKEYVQGGYSWLIHSQNPPKA